MNRLLVIIVFLNLQVSLGQEVLKSAFQKQINGNFHEAMGLFKAVLAINPLDSVALVNMVKCHKELHIEKQAVKYLDTMLQSQPDYPLALILRAELQKWESDFTSCIADCEKLIKSQKKLNDAYVLSADCFSKLGQNRKAINAYTNALLIDSRNTAIILEKAICENRLGDYNAAIKDYSTLINLSPNDTFLIMLRADVFFSKEDYPNAIRDYLEAIKSGKRFNVYLSLGRAYNYLKKYHEALSVFNKALQTENNNEFIYYSIGDIKLKSNDNKGALMAFNKSIEIQPSREAYLARSDLKKRLKNIKAAKLDYKMAEEYERAILDTYFSFFIY